MYFAEIKEVEGLDFRGNTQINYSTIVKKGQIIMKEFYNALKERLEEKNMSVYKLSKETGIFQQTLYALVNGNTSSPRLDHAVKIAKVLEIDLIN